MDGSGPSGEEHGGAEALFAEYVAARADGLAPDFESWVREHPEEAATLRRLYRHWSTFERELELLHAPPPAAPPGREPQAGETVGDFELLEVLGVGGMGRVWRARERKLGREVALKLLLAERRTARGLAFFTREARAASRVRHPGVVAVFGAGEDDGLHWIASELVPGGRTMATLLEAARQRERLPPGWFAHVARLFARVADAVEAAHRVEVIHRDLKPRNILIAPGGAPKVTDFGLARIGDEAAVSRTGDVAGTLYYMSPEQITGRRIGIDHRTDVFSLGALLYEALTLRCPFAADSEYEIAEKILYEELPDARALSAEVPRELAWICAKALEKRRGDRFATMAEMRDELLAFSERKPVRTRPMGLLGRARKRLLRAPVRSALIAVAALALVASGLLFGAKLRSDRRAREAEYERQLAALYVSAGESDLAGAAAAARRAGELKPDEPEPHILLALALAEFDRWEEVSAEVGRAAAKGYRPAPRAEATPEELVLEALARLAGRQSLADPEARAALEAALARDGTLEPAWFLLYRVRAAQGDSEGALAALRRFRAFLDAGHNPRFAGVVDALVLEYDGRYAEAIEQLERLDGEDPRGLPGPLVTRALGRVLLRARRLEEARETLERALADQPDDRSSLLNLGNVHLSLAEGAETLAEREDELARAEALADRTLELWGGADDASWLRAQTAAARVLWRGAEYGLEEVEEALRRVEAALERRPAPEELRELRPLLRTQRAHFALESGDLALAVADFEAAIEELPGYAWAHYLYAQQLQAQQREEEALAQLERALECLTDDGERARYAEPESLCAWIDVWALYCAAQLGRSERCEELRAELEERLAAGASLPAAEAITFAETLALAPLAGLRDCARALELIQDPAFEAELEAYPALADACEPLLEQIRGACP